MSLLNNETILRDRENNLKKFFELQILLRALIESKFNRISYDEEILGSEVVAKTSRKIVEELDELAKDLLDDDTSPNANWLKVTHKRHRAYQTVMRKLVSLSKRSKSIWSSDSDNDLIVMIDVYFSPYTIDKSVAEQFLVELRKKVLK